MNSDPISTIRRVGAAALLLAATTFAEPPATLPATLPTTLPIASLPSTAPASGPTTAPATVPTTSPASRTSALSEAQAAEIQTLIADLAGDDWRNRDAAQRRLVEKGELVRPALQELVARTSDAEVRNRAQDALAQLAEGDRTGETRVTLHLVDAQPAEVIAELSKQARAPIEVWPETIWRFRPRGAVTLDIDRKPFWEALAEVCEKLKLRPQAIGNERGFTLVDNGGGGGPNPLKGPSFLSGPFMFAANTVNEAKSLTFDRGGGGANPQHSLNLDLTLYAEPKLKVLGRSYQVSVTEATDEAGRSLLPTDRPVGMAGMMGMDVNVQNNMMSIGLPLKPGTGAKKLAKLRGVQKLLLQTKTESAEFAEAMNAKGQTRELAGSRFTLKDIKHQGPGNVQVNIACVPVNGAGGPAALFRLGRARQSPTVAGELRVLDAAGATLMRTRIQFFNGQGESNMSSGFGGDPRKPPGEPAKVIIEVASETREVEVPFEFNDLPLP